MGLYDYLATPTGAANMRGAVDFSDAGAFTLAEKGHSLLAVLDTPKMMTVIKNVYAAGKMVEKAVREDGTVEYQLIDDPENLTDENLVNIIKTFPTILESEFKGLDGLDGMTSNTLEISDNISTLNVLGTVEYPTNQEITMRFTEKEGRPITKYCSTYLRAIRDPRTRAKTYLGCANPDSTTLVSDLKLNEDTAHYDIQPSLANEVFTFLYIVPDNTWTKVENAYLLCNAQLTKAPFDNLDNFDKGDISLVEIDLSFNTFVITENEIVYELAQKFLNSYVSKSKYNANKWNINSDRLEYKVFDDVFNTSKATNTAGAAKYTIKNTTAGGASAKELANSPTDEASSTYVK